jgi:hypothetical protein
MRLAFLLNMYLEENLMEHMNYNNKILLTKEI